MPLGAGGSISVNVGVPRTVEWLGHPVTSAIWKQPASGPVALRGVNFAGDDQADRRAHGGPDKAVYAYGLATTSSGRMPTACRSSPACSAKT